MLVDLLFEDVCVGRCLLAPDGSVLRTNREWLRLTGATQAGAAASVAALAATGESAAALCAKARPGRRVELPPRWRDVDGRATLLAGSIDPVPMEGGTGLLVSARDVTCSMAALSRTEAALRHAAAVAQLGTWWMEMSNPGDVDANPLFWSDEVYRLFGYAPREVEVSNALFFRHVHPEDQGSVRDAVARALATRTPYVVEHRVLPRGGSERIVLEHGAFEFDGDDCPLRLVGVIQDVTDRRRSEKALIENERDLNRAQAVARTGSWRLDIRRNELLWSDETHRLFGIPKGTPLTYETFLSAVHPDDRELVDATWQAAVRGAPYDVEHRIVVGREVRWVREKAELDFGPDGELEGGFGTVQDITEPRRLQDALRSANEQLVEADRRKDEFLAMLSHELRNPLAPIRSSAHVLRHAEPGSAAARRSQEVIERQAAHLARLVDDLLDVTRIARGKIELRRAPVDLREVLRRAEEDFRSTLEARSVAFRVALPDEEVWVEVDATRIAQLVGNLLHNAAKFTSAGGEVALQLRTVGDAVEVRVRDTGIGIDAALLPRVFDPFIQGERSLARTEGGLGLGLALVKAIAELHGGNARVASAGAGEGAEFIVALPRAAVPTLRGHVEQSPIAPAGRRVLIVEDSVDAAESLADVVSMLRHTVEVAHDGPTALEKARANPPEVVLCDIGLPGMSGYDVARALRATCPSGMQLVALSGYARPEDVTRAVEAGFDSHIAKPADIAELERVLST